MISDSTRSSPPPRQPAGDALHLHIDASRGIAGDMLLAALIDLGVPEESIFAPLAALPPHSVELGRAERRSIQVRTLTVTGRETDPPHRGLPAIEALIHPLEISERARELALACFRTIAAAEGAVHGIPAEEVHFHEIGAIDSLVDIIGVCHAVALLDPVEISCTSLPLGSGEVETAHGLLPIPAPATLRILEGVPTHPFSVGREVTTPTGAALAKVLADRFGDPPAGVLVASGTGAGGRIAPPNEPPNILRVWTSRAEASAAATERVILLETNLDTVAGEDAGGYVEALLAEGSLDAWITAIHGKKGRPGLLLSALAREENAAALRRAIFRLTGTLGVRQRTCRREVLPREVVDLSFEGRTVRVKRAWLEGELLWERPEHDDLARLAAERGVTLREIRARVDDFLAARRSTSKGGVTPENGREGEL